MNVEEIIVSLVKEPGHYWSDNPRQKEKLEKRINKACGALGFSHSELAKDVIDIAVLRLKASATTIFLSSIGSSGSHLFQSCITRSWPSIPLGEIYLPKRLISDAQNLTSDERSLLCEAYLLLHDYTFTERYNTSALLINTLHHPRLSKFGEWSARYRAALIVRNPIDIVLSRTYRKDEYRNYLGQADASDMDYLFQNIDKVESFFSRSRSFDYIEKIKFEDLFRNGDLVSGQIMNLVGKASYKMDPKVAIQSAIADGKSTNKYDGETRSIPVEIRDVVAERLDSTCKQFGY